VVAPPAATSGEQSCASAPPSRAPACPGLLDRSTIAPMRDEREGGRREAAGELEFDERLTVTG
jgi:hypothetical protein